MKVLTTLILCFCSSIFMAQSIAINLAPESEMPLVKGKSLAQALFSFSKATALDLNLKKEINSLTATHYYYDIELNNRSIFGAQAHAIAHKGSTQLKRFIHNAPQEWNVFSNTFPNQRDNALLQEYSDYEILTSTEVYVYQQNTLKPARLLEIATKDMVHKRWLYNDTDILLEQNLHKEKHLAGPNDTIVNAYVFDPDPLSTAQVNYGSPYLDLNDNASAAIIAQQKLRPITLSFINDTIVAENDFVIIKDFSAPNIAPVSRTDNQFLYNRNESGFEDMNVMYHISHTKQHLDNLGFTNLPGYRIEIDPHALNGDDNSYFFTGATPHRILFGEGGVDDAEDADVVIHEFIHAYVLAASNNNNGSTERNMIEEALGDYFAASYSITQSTYNSGAVFNWDGHNEFWDGRMVSSTKDYKQISIGGDIYAHTDIFASPLMEINSIIGRNAADQIIMEAIFSLGQTTTMPQMAKYIYQADSALNGGIHYNTIVTAFVRRNILDSNLVDLKENITQNTPLIITNTIGFAQGEALSISTEQGLIKQCILYNSLGEKVWMKDYNQYQQSEVSISSSRLKSGVYILKVITDQEIYSQKLIKY